MDTLIERKPGINRKRLYWVGDAYSPYRKLESDAYLLWQWRKTG